MDSLSASDIMAMNNNGNQWMNNPFMYLVWLALLGNGSFGGWGNNGNNASTQGAITRSDIFDGFNSQDVNSMLRSIGNGLCDGFYSMNSAIKDNTTALGSAITENRYAAQSAACETNRNIDSVKAEAYQNTCAITNAIHSEGEETRALITANTMQSLRDALEAKDRELLNAQFQLSQTAQTAAIVNQLQPVSRPAYITCSPYASSSCCGSTTA